MLVACIGTSGGTSGGTSDGTSGGVHLFGGKYDDPWEVFGTAASDEEVVIF